jgi:hypothetical protein
MSDCKHEHVERGVGGSDNVNEDYMFCSECWKRIGEVCLKCNGEGGTDDDMCIECAGVGWFRWPDSEEEAE